MLMPRYEIMMSQIRETREYATFEVQADNEADAIEKAKDLDEDRDVEYVPDGDRSEVKAFECRATLIPGPVTMDDLVNALQALLPVALDTVSALSLAAEDRPRDESLRATASAVSAKYDEVRALLALAREQIKMETEENSWEVIRS
jgi:hypothetical protein